jgi:hypothetical protein
VLEKIRLAFRNPLFVVSFSAFVGALAVNALQGFESLGVYDAESYVSQNCFHMESAFHLLSQQLF